MASSKRGLLFMLLVSLLYNSISGEDCAETLIDCSGDGEIPVEYPSISQDMMDTIFVLDGSTSIGEKSFILAKDFVADFIADFDMGAEKSRVGVITYGTNVTLHLGLQETGDIGRDKTTEKIKAIQQPGGGTRTGQGVKAMTTKFETEGRLDQPDVKSMAFILTDGRSQQPPGENAKLARDQGIVLYAIGIGEEINKEELLSIAGSEDRVILIQNFEALKDLKKELFSTNDVVFSKPLDSKCVQVECMLDEEGVPTMRVLVPQQLDSCCRGVIGSCDSVKFIESTKVGFLQKDIKAGECGTSFAVSEKNLEYGNVLNLYEESDDGLIIRDETEWRLKCTYPRVDIKTVLFDTSRRARNVSEDGIIPMELEIFDNLFTKVLPKPPIYGLKDEVFVQASMAAYDQLELFPLNCWSTMDKDPNHRIRKDLIVDGCDKEDTLKRHEAGTSVQTRFSFEAFRYHGPSCKVFIHCELLICEAGDPGSRCSQGCQSRRKRSATTGNFLSSQRIMVGPLIVADIKTPSKSSAVEGVNRLRRLQDVGRKLDAMMSNMRRNRFRRRLIQN